MHRLDERMIESGMGYKVASDKELRIRELEIRLASQQALIDGMKHLKRDEDKAMERLRMEALMAVRALEICREEMR
jgi:uncharacterized coiled-coil protein SlyX